MVNVQKLQSPTMRPDITVVIPTYNRKQYLRQAIASCFAGNEAIDVEVVVVDDGSTDGTRTYLEQLRDPRVRPIFQEHQGGQVARNRGLAEARGQYVKFLDDDDLLHEGALQIEFNKLTSYNAQVCSSGYVVHDIGNDKRTYVPPPNDADMISCILDGRLSTHPLSLTYQRDLLSNIIWEPNLVGRQDIQFAINIALKYPHLVSVKESVAIKRNHDGTQQRDRAANVTDVTQTHAEILISAVYTLRKEGCLCGERRSAAVQGLWQWAHIISGYDLRFFSQIYSEILSIDPEFMPSRSSNLLYYLDKVFSPRLTERIVYPVRRIKNSLI
jgi:glycosyltransferase involved in cell wall biosynthesis